MAVRDLFSNFNATILWTQWAFEFPAMLSPAVDLSKGTTTTFNVWIPNNFEGMIISEIKIQYSEDAAFTAPVDDPGNLGNLILDGDTGVAPVLPFDVDSSEGFLILAHVLNPPGTYRYARIVVNDSTSADGNMFGTAFTGPARFVAPKGEV